MCSIFICCNSYGVFRLKKEVKIVILILSILILAVLSTIALIAANKIDEEDLMEELKKEFEKQEKGDK